MRSVSFTALRKFYIEIPKPVLYNVFCSGVFLENPLIVYRRKATRAFPKGEENHVHC